MRSLLWPYLRTQWPAFALSLLLALSMAALAALQPLLTRLAVDQGLIHHDFARLGLACGGMLLLALIGYALGGLHRTVYLRASGRTLFALRGSLYAHLLKVSPRELQRQPVGDLVSRLDGDIAEVQRFGTDAALSFVTSTLSLCAVGIVMFTLSWPLAAVVTMLLPLQLVVRRAARPRGEAAMRAAPESAARLSSFLVESLSGIRQVQAAAAERQETERLESLSAGYLERVLTQQRVGYWTASLNALIGHLATAATFLFGGWLVLKGSLTVGTLIAFVAYLGRSAGSAASVASLYSGYHRARVCLERVRALQSLPAVEESPDAQPLAADARGDLQFIDVTVLAGEARPLLDAVSFDLPAGNKVILRGVSGAGKSTLADLLRRFLEPGSGRILLDGLPLSRYRLADLRRRIAVVEHSPVLFRGSILDNLRYGHESIAREVVVEAARRAGVDSFVQQLPQGYDTPVGEGGAGLSTGQRQRIAIVRAALADPLIVVLDEATSGLDMEATRLVHDALDGAFPGRTRLVITHRPAEIDRADLRWRLDAGRLDLAASA